LAIVNGLKTFKQYLLGRHFVVRTDHAALQWLRKTPELMGQQARWLTFIEQFNFQIQHRIGTKHGNADSLSRRPEDDEYHARVTRNEETDIKQRVSKVDLVNSNSTIQSGSDRCSAGESLADKQLKDPDIGPLLAWRLRQVDPPLISELVAESVAAKELWSQWHSLVLKNGVLYRRHEYKNGQPVAMQLIVPSSMKNDFIKQVHGGMCRGHMGIRRSRSVVTGDIGEGMFADFADNVRLVQNTSEVSCRKQPTSSHY